MGTSWRDEQVREESNPDRRIWKPVGHHDLGPRNLESEKTAKAAKAEAN